MIDDKNLNENLNKNNVINVNYNVNNDYSQNIKNLTFKQKILDLPFTIEERYNYFQIDKKFLLDILQSQSELVVNQKMSDLTLDYFIKYVQNINIKIFKKQLLSSVEKYNYIIYKFLHLSNIDIITPYILVKIHEDFEKIIEEKYKNELFFDMGLCDKILCQIEWNQEKLLGFKKLNSVVVSSFYSFLINPVSFYDKLDQENW